MSDNALVPERNDIVIRSRRHIDITGVRDVISFDDRSIVAVTRCGDMAVEGDALKIEVIDVEKEILSIDGKISAVIYYDSEPPKKRRIFGRMSKKDS